MNKIAIVRSIITLHVTVLSVLNSLIKRHKVAEWVKKRKRPTYMLLTVYSFQV